MFLEGMMESIIIIIIIIIVIIIIIIIKLRVQLSCHICNRWFAARHMYCVGIFVICLHTGFHITPVIYNHHQAKN